MSFLTIQALRAVAALMVVAYHVFEMWGQRIDSNAPGVTWGNGAAGVDIFFVISGFVMVISSRRLADQPGGWLTFLTHRVIRIVPLYWLLTTVKLIAVVAFAGYVMRTRLDFNFIAASYLFLPVVDTAGHFRPILPVGWTLTYEFLFYLIFAAALAFWIEALRLVLPVLGLFAVIALMRDRSWPVWTILFDTIVLEFVFGVVLAKLTLQGRRLPPVVAGVLVAGGFLLILIVPLYNESARILIWGIPAFAIVAGAVSLEPFIGKTIPRWLLALGDASYSIYLSHGFVLPVFGVAVGMFGLSGSGVEALTFIACLVASSIAGMILYTLVENPVLQAMKHGSEQARPVGPA